jgi:hypothetical protein
MFNYVQFQKIYVVSMPSRTDKRDALALSAYLTGLEVEFIDGPNGSLISPKAAPEVCAGSQVACVLSDLTLLDVGLERTARNPGMLAWPHGCLSKVGRSVRSHEKILIIAVHCRMVRERIQSALIMEDDADWDIMIKAQMTEFARGTRHLQKSTRKTLSPYGDGWDIMATGHCGLQNYDWQDQEYWLIQNDPTVLHPSEMKFWRKPNLDVAALKGDYNRLVLSPHKFTCLGSYAVSLAGAARIIYDQSILPNGREIDIALSTFCRRRPYGQYGCLASYPMITGIYRPAGSRSKDSDRKELGVDKIRETAVSENLMFSVRLNLASLLHGQTLVKAQFPETAMLKDIDAATLRIPRGAPAFVKAEEYVKKDQPPDVACDLANCTNSN